MIVGLLLRQQRDSPSRAQPLITALSGIDVFAVTSRTWRHAWRPPVSGTRAGPWRTCDVDVTFGWKKTFPDFRGLFLRMYHFSSGRELGEGTLDVFATRWIKLLSADTPKRKAAMAHFITVRVCAAAKTSRNESDSFLLILRSRWRATYNAAICLTAFPDLSYQSCLITTATASRGPRLLARRDLARDVSGPIAENFH